MGAGVLTLKILNIEILTLDFMGNTPALMPTEHRNTYLRFYGQYSSSHADVLPIKSKVSISMFSRHESWSIVNKT
jgi:hypothetical protein